MDLEEEVFLGEVEVDLGEEEVVLVEVEVDLGEEVVLKK